MYLPPHFVVDDPARLFDFIEGHSFGMLMTRCEGRLFCTHLPLLLDRVAGERGTLIGHVARANPQWRDAAGQEGLAIFAGPHAYVSPAWYDAENVVPTWNYVAVHATGTIEVFEDVDELLNVLRRTVGVYESPRDAPWAFEGDTEFARCLAGQVVGLRLTITRLEGKWKLSQNHPQERRDRVIAALAASANAEERAVAQLMRDGI